jgi:heme A synthase
MEHNAITEYLILHVQQIFTISLFLTFSIVFGNYTNISTATIPISYRETLLAISCVSFAVIILSHIFHIRGKRKREEEDTGEFNTDTGYIKESTEDKIKMIHHGLSAFFLLVVIIFLGIYLNEGNMNLIINQVFTGFSIFLLFFSLIFSFICVDRNHTRTRIGAYIKAAKQLEG